MRNTAVVIALVGLALAASFSSSMDEDEVQALENELEKVRDDFPSERFEPTFQDNVGDAKPIEEDELFDADYEEGEGMETKYNQVQNDYDDLVENRMDSVFNNLGEKVSDPFPRRSRFSRRSFRRHRRRRRRLRECIRLSGRCR